jgi:hypothetical protein
MADDSLTLRISKATGRSWEAVALETSIKVRVLEMA